MDGAELETSTDDLLKAAACGLTGRERRVFQTQVCTALCGGHDPLAKKTGAVRSADSADRRADADLRQHATSDFWGDCLRVW